jgi:aldehyde:ferredoxin oxidoreductase
MSSGEVCGYAGKLLRIDLDTRKITEERLDETELRKYVGGTGLGAKFLYEEVSTSIGWFNPGNRLIWASGPLGATRIPGGGTFSVVTKGCLTGRFGASQANGFFGAYLKLSGLDGIIIQGASDKPVYLYIHDGTAEFRDASHLVGKDTWETDELIKKELGHAKREMSVAGIGPAGENLVKFAAIVADKGHVAGHNGMGAVMGSKKLKAIAVAPGFPARSGDYHPIAVASLPEACAVFGSGDVRSDHAGDWVNQPRLVSALVWSGKGLSLLALTVVRQDGYD